MLQQGRDKPSLPWEHLKGPFAATGTDTPGSAPSERAPGAVPSVPRGCRLSPAVRTRGACSPAPVAGPEQRHTEGACSGRAWRQGALLARPILLLPGCLTWTGAPRERFVQPRVSCSFWPWPLHAALPESPAQVVGFSSVCGMGGCKPGSLC